MSRSRSALRVPADRAVGLLLVLVVHAAGLWVLWQHRLLPLPRESALLFVNLVTPPALPKKMEPLLPKPPRQRPPRRVPVELEQPRQIVAEVPPAAPDQPVAAFPPPPSPAGPAPRTDTPPVQPPAGPVMLTAELAVACPERSPPSYPARSRRLAEQGTVVLRVELDETGHVAAARVQKSSGHDRLDEAALAAVRAWRCTPARRNGEPVRAVALQPINFVLQGN